MRIEGSWKLCDDGVLRPAFVGMVNAADGSQIQAWFLVDTGADRTVLSEELFRALNIPPDDDMSRLEGVGGQTPSVTLATTIEFLRDDGAPVTFKGRFAAFIDPAALDMSVLGRNITNLFALIVDRPGDIVCLVGGGHAYQIVPRSPSV